MNNERKTAVKVSTCGLFAALSVVIMLVAHIPTLTYAVPALAGALSVIIFLEFGTSSAFTVYFAVSVLSFLLCEKEAFICYVLFFGYYPILKAYIERINLRLLQWIIKFAVFNVAFSLAMYLAFLLFGIPFIDDIGYGIYGIIVFLVALELMFFVYDIALTRVITLYILKYRQKFRKLMRLDRK